LKIIIFIYMNNTQLLIVAASLGIIGYLYIQNKKKKENEALAVSIRAYMPYYISKERNNYVNPNESLKKFDDLLHTLPNVELKKINDYLAAYSGKYDGNKAIADLQADADAILTKYGINKKK